MLKHVEQLKLVQRCLAQMSRNKLQLL